MLDVGTDFKNMFKSNERKIELKITITGSGVRTYKTSEIIDFELVSNAMSNDGFSIGNFIANQIDFTLKVPKSLLEDNALVEVQIGIDTDGTDSDFEEWGDQTNLYQDGTVVYTDFGTYYITSISDVNGKYVSASALDVSINTHRDYESLLTYPATMRDVASEISTMSGVDLDDDFLTTIPSDYYVQLMPTTETYQSILGYIAGACGGNINMNPDGTMSLRLLSTSDIAVEDLEMGHYYSLESLGEKVTLSAVRLYESDEYTEGTYNETTLGTGSDRATLDIYNPFVDESIHADLYSRFNGFTYVPVSIEYIGFPFLEAGDKISIAKDARIKWGEAFVTWELADFAWDRAVENVQAYVFETTLSITGGLRGNIKSPAVSEQESASTSAGTLSNYVQQLDKATVKESIAYNGVTTSRAEGVVVNKSDGLAKAVFNATEGISLYSDTGSGLEKNFYVGTDGYLYANKMKISGGSEVDGLGDLAYLDYIDTDDVTGLGDLATLNSITSTYIEDGAIITAKLAVGAVLADNINANAITSDKIAANAITTSKIDVDYLSGISADLGTITAGRITSVDIDINEDVSIGDNLFLKANNNGNGIVWGTQLDRTAEIYIDSGSEDIFITADNDVRLEPRGEVWIGSTISNRSLRVTEDLYVYDNCDIDGNLEVSEWIEVDGNRVAVGLSNQDFEFQYLSSNGTIEVYVDGSYKGAITLT